MSALFEQSADPTEALHSFENFSNAHLEIYGKAPQFDDTNQDFLRLFGNSRFLSHMTACHPVFLKNYTDSLYKDKEKPYDVFLSELKMTVSHAGNDVLAAIRHYKYQEYCRLTIKELSLKDSEITYRELANLANACLSVYSEFLCGELCKRFSLTSPPCDFSIIGMGKLGGLELNYSSDIDLIGIYSEEAETNGVTSHEFYSRLFSTLGQHFTQSVAGGFVFRVDWDLRPEGKAGTIANSLSAMERYYETFGATWERQAYIKAEVAHDSGKLGSEFLQMMRPFIFRKSLGEEDVEEILAIRMRRLGEIHHRSQHDINVKLDEGGIRDIEFFIQSLQLLFGGRIPALRIKSSIPALRELMKQDLVSKADGDFLIAAYYFLRRIETAIQMENESQTHTLSTDETFLKRIACRIGWPLNQRPLGEMLDELHSIRARVKKLCLEIH